MRHRRESSTEHSACKKLAQRGAISRKMNGLGNASWPDRLFLGAERTVLFIEFKRHGQKLTPLQVANHRLLRRLGFTVEVCYSVDEAIDAWDKVAGLDR